jgi:hypothetical protein
MDIAAVTGAAVMAMRVGERPSVAARFAAMRGAAIAAVAGVTPVAEPEASAADMRLAVVEGFTAAAVDSTAAVVEDSTAAAVDMAAGTGKGLRTTRRNSIQERLSFGAAVLFCSEEGASAGWRKVSGAGR